MRCLPCLPLLLLACGVSIATAQPSQVSAQERAAIAALGPWPPPQRPDPSNRVSGKPLAIELGRRLFFDPRMSPIGYIACVTCHQPDRAFTDAKPRAHGLADLPRNTPALANLRLQRWYGWDGASDSLWLASLRPMLDAREFDSHPAVVARVYRRDPELAACYRAVFGESASGSAERVMVNTGKALAAYQETLRTARTPFDDFRDALLRGDAAAAARYPAAAQRGLKLFIGDFGCVQCHAGPNLSDDRFHRDTEPRADAADPGRRDGLRALHVSRFNLRGPYNDGAVAPIAARATALDDGAFRTPSLRNVAHTAPYLHDGRVDALRDAAQHRWRGRGEPLPAPAQVDDLQAFLVSLSDAHGARRPAPAAPIACP